MLAKVVVPLVVALALALSSCGDPGTNDEVTVASKPYVDALVGDLSAHGAGDIELTATQARCLAPRWVNVLQPERLQAAGIRPGTLARDVGFDVKAAEVPLTDGEVGHLVDAFGACDVDLEQAYVDHVTAGHAPDPTDRDCLADALSDDLLRRLVSVELTKGAAAVDQDANLSSELFDALSTCPGAIDVAGS